MFISKLFSLTRGSAFLFAAASLFLTGCGGGKKIPGLDHVSARVIGNSLYVGFLAERLNWDAGAIIEIPGLEGATVGVTPALTGGTDFTFTIPLASLLHQGTFYPSSGFPDGRPLPDIEGGMLPRWDVPLSHLTLSLYLSTDAFGLFVPLDLRDKKGIPLPFPVSAFILDERGNRLGKVYAIPLNVSGGVSGLFVLLPYLGGNTSAASLSTQNQKIGVH